MTHAIGQTKIEFLQDDASLKKIEEIAALSEEAFQRYEGISAVLLKALESLVTTTYTADPSNVLKIARKLQIIRIRIDDTPTIDANEKTALFKKLDDLGKTLSPDRGDQETDFPQDALRFVDKNAALMHDLTDKRHICLDLTSTLKCSAEFSEYLNDSRLEWFLKNFSDASITTTFDFEKCPHLGLLTPSLVLKYCPRISFSSFQGIARAPERFTDAVLLVDGHKIAVNKAFLSTISPFFNSLFTTSMEGGKEGDDYRLDFDFDDVQNFIGFFTGAFTLSSETSFSTLRSLYKTANALLVPRVFLKSVEEAMADYINSNHSDFWTYSMQDLNQIAGECILAQDTPLFTALCRRISTVLGNELEKCNPRDKLLTVYTHEEVRETFLTGYLQQLDELTQCDTILKNQQLLDAVVSEFLQYMGYNIYEPELALPLLKRLSELCDDPNAEIAVKIGHLRALYLRLYSESDAWDEAKKFYETLLERTEKSDHFVYYSLLLVDLLRTPPKGVTAQTAQAKSVVDAALKKSPLDYHLHILHAQILFKDEQNLTGAISHYRQLPDKVRSPIYHAYLLCHMPLPPKKRISELLEHRKANFEEIPFLCYCKARVSNEDVSEECAEAVKFNKHQGFYSCATGVVEELPPAFKERTRAYLKELETHWQQFILNAADHDMGIGNKLLLLHPHIRAAPL